MPNGFTPPSPTPCLAQISDSSTQTAASPTTQFSQNSVPPTQSAPSASTQVSQFSESLMRDAQAAASLAAGLDMASVERMVCALDKCEGQFLISGVGECINNTAVGM